MRRTSARFALIGVAVAAASLTAAPAGAQRPDRIRDVIGTLVPTARACSEAETAAAAAAAAQPAAEGSGPTVRIPMCDSAGRLQLILSFEAQTGRPLIFSLPDGRPVGLVLPQIFQSDRGTDLRAINSELTRLRQRVAQLEQALGRRGQ